MTWRAGPMTLLLMPFILACAHHVDCASNSCPAEIPLNIRENPRALRALIVDARTRRFPDACFSCEDGSACFSCERLLGLGIERLAAVPTDDAAKEAAAIVLDERLHWDGGPALMIARAVSTMGQRVVPYLRPYASKSPLAAQIVECIEQNLPCV